MNTKQLAALCNCSTSTVSRLASSGLILGRKVNGRWMFDESAQAAVMAYLNRERFKFKPMPEQKPPKIGRAETVNKDGVVYVPPLRQFGDTPKTCGGVPKAWRDSPELARMCSRFAAQRG